MRKFLRMTLSLALVLLLCTACGVHVLTDSLPLLIDPDTQLPQITSIQVTRLSDQASVTLEEAADLNEMMLHLDGIQCVRNKTDLTSFSEEYPPQYEITFTEIDVATTLVVCGDEEFYLAGYSFLAMRGGMDLFYLDSLFASAAE